MSPPRSLWSTSQPVQCRAEPHHNQICFFILVYITHCQTYVQQEKELEQMLQWESKQKKVQVGKQPVVPL